MGKGKLTFKGENTSKPAKKKKKSKSKVTAATTTNSSSFIHNTTTSQQYESDEQQQQQQHISTANTSHLTASTTNNHTERQQQAKIQEGTGNLISSGTTIMGCSDTKFKREFRAGDALIVNGQMRVVKFVLGDASASLSSAFVPDIAQPAAFQYIRAPNNNNKQDLEASKKQRKEENEKAATGSGRDEFVYREKTSTGTSYSIKKVQLSGNSGGGDTTARRETLLNMRSKKKSDRYCM